MPWLYLTAVAPEELEPGAPTTVFVECTSEADGHDRGRSWVDANRQVPCGCGCERPRNLWVPSYYPTDLFDGPFISIERAVARNTTTTRLGSFPGDPTMTCVYYKTPTDFALAHQLALGGPVLFIPLVTTPPTPVTNTAVSACPECNGTDAACDLCVEITRPNAQPTEVES